MTEERRNELNEKLARLCMSNMERAKDFQNPNNTEADLVRLAREGYAEGLEQIAVHMELGQTRLQIKI